MRRSSKIVCLLLTVLMLGACSRTSALEVGQEAPDFTLQNLEGNQVSLSSFKGKVVIVDFFASWCPPCREEIPDFIELEKAYGAGGFAMVGVALVSRQEASDFAKSMGINYPVLLDDGKVSVAYGPVRAIPTTFVLDKDMKIAKIYIGFKPKDVFEADIKELLSK